MIPIRTLQQTAEQNKDAQAEIQNIGAFLRTKILRHQNAEEKRQPLTERVDCRRPKGRLLEGLDAQAHVYN